MLQLCGGLASSSGCGYTLYNVTLQVPTPFPRMFTLLTAMRQGSARRCAHLKLADSYSGRRSGIPRKGKARCSSECACIPAPEVSCQFDTGNALCGRIRQRRGVLLPGSV